MKGRNRSILFRIQTFKVSLPGMNNKMVYSALLTHNLHKILEMFISVHIIHSNPALDRHWDANHLPHLPSAGSDKRRLFHKTGPKLSFLDLGTRTPDIQIDLIIPPLLGNLGTNCQFFRGVAPQLNGNGMLNFIKMEDLLAFIVVDGVFVDHLGVEHYFARN